MIDIINGFGFKRNHPNTILFSVSNLSSVTGMQRYQLKEHYFNCVMDDCFSEGEFHVENVENKQIEIYIPLYSVKHMLSSLTHEGFMDEAKTAHYNILIDAMVETQNITSDLFDSNGYYSDFLRKINPRLPPMIESITRNPE